MGISIDTPASAAHFAEHLKLKFPLLGDWPRYETGKKYGVFSEERSIHARATFVVDSAGLVRAALVERDASRHPSFALDAVRALGAD